MIFWVFCIGLTLAVAALLARTVLRGGDAPGAAPAAASDVQLYRDQLAEVDRDRARGLIAETEAERLRTEISRRLLAADAAASKASHTPRTSPGVGRAGAALALLLMLGAVPLYALYLGSPGYADLPLQSRIDAAQDRLQNRPSQAEAEAAVPAGSPPRPDDVDEDFLTLMDRLRQAVAERPDDEQGLRLLARNEAALGNYRAAHMAQARLIDLLGDRATAADHVDHADMLILATGGYVSPEAGQAIQAALTKDPQNAPATYLLGLMMQQVGRPDAAFRLWDRLLQQGPPDAPWIPPIQARIETVAAQAGVTDYTPPTPAEGLSGPSAADIEAAQDMDPEARQQMIRGMVESLSGRLATQGGSAAEWARLIRALGVLGDTAQARAITDEARQVFAGQDEALAEIDAAANDAGLTE